MTVIQFNHIKKINNYLNMMKITIHKFMKDCHPIISWLINKSWDIYLINVMTAPTFRAMALIYHDNRYHNTVIWMPSHFAAAIYFSTNVKFCDNLH